jgi:hypothetical protein
MLRALPRLSSLLLLFAFAVAAAAAEEERNNSVPKNPLSGKELIAALKQGGYVIYFRHTSTDFGQNDESMTNFEDCATQRNLTDKGREEARKIGAAMRELQLPIGKVLASPFCRTHETATLAFERAEKSMDLRGGPFIANDNERYSPLRTQLGLAPGKGTNTMLVGHGNPFRSIAGPPHLSEGEGVVVTPRGEGKFEIVARVKLEDWAMLLGAR